MISEGGSARFPPVRDPRKKIEVGERISVSEILASCRSGNIGGSGGFVPVVCPSSLADLHGAGGFRGYHAPRCLTPRLLGACSSLFLVACPSVVNPTSHALTFSNTPIRSSIDGRSPPPVYSLEPGGPFSRTQRPQPQPQDNSVIVTRAPFHNECGSEGSSGHSQPSTRAPLPSRCSKRHREPSSTGSHVRPAR